jgi:hypothetical protein
MNIQHLKQKYSNWTYLTSQPFNTKAVRYQRVFGKKYWASLKKKYMLTDMIVYNTKGDQHQTTPTSLELIHKIMHYRPSDYTYVDKTWLVLYTVEWADYLHTVLNVPLDKIWVLCDSKEREDVCNFNGYNIISLFNVSERDSSGKFIIDRRVNTWEKNMKKFDNIVGNPPFDYEGNSNFYIEFIKLSQKIIKESGYFDFVIPNRFLKKNSNAGKAINKWLEATYVMPTVNHYFDIGTEVGVIGGIAADNPKFNIIPYDFDNGTILHRSLNDTTPLTGICTESVNIVDKVVKSSFGKMRSIGKDELVTNYVYIKRMMERYCPTKTKGGPHRFMTLINQVDKMFGSKVEFSSLEEATVNEWFMSQSKLGRFLTYSYPAAFGYSTSSLVHTGDMPSIPVTKLTNGDLVVTHKGSNLPVILNDNFFYDLFELTSDEVKYLEYKLLPKERPSKRKDK